MLVSLTQAAEGRWEILYPDGRIVMNGRLQPTDSFTIPIERLPAGIYMLKVIKTGQPAEVRRFVKSN